MILTQCGMIVWIFNGAFDVASELLWTERFGLKDLHQLYTPQTVQKPM